MSNDATATRAAELLRLHTDPELLQVVNVWDAITAKVVTDVPGTTALATASHSIAATLGYADGENIPVAEMIDMCGRIVAATHLPVSADLEAGYGDPGDTVRRAIGVGVVGANLEDQMKPLDQAVAAVGPPWWPRARPRACRSCSTPAPTPSCAAPTATPPTCWPTRSSAAGRSSTPARRASSRRASSTSTPSARSSRRSASGGCRRSACRARRRRRTSRRPGVARISYGPWTQRVALTALADLTADLLGGGALPEGTRPLN